MTDNARIQLAKKALEHVTGECFTYYVSASTGGKCDDGWCDDVSLNLSREQMLYLIETGETKFLFEGLELEPIDVEEKMNEDMMEAAWPDGGPTAYVNHIIPNELLELENEIDLIDETYQEDVDAIREKLKQIAPGDYTFSFTIDADGYEFTDDAEEEICLTTQEALNLLCASTLDKKILFEGLCDEQLDEEDAESIINEKAKKLGFAEDYDNFCYGAEEYVEYDNCIDSWKYVISHILSGDITEKSFNSWMEYFSDSNYDYSIVDWYENIREESDENDDE